MTSALVWDRNDVITQLRSRLWRHLSPAATSHGVHLDAAALLQLEEEDIARLADLHFVLHPAQAELLAHTPALLRRLRSSTAASYEIGHDRVRGPVDGLATVRERARTRSPVVVTRPQVRDRDVQPARLLALMLNELRDRAAQTAAWWPYRSEGTGLAARVGEIGRRAAALAAHRALADVTSAAPTPRELADLDSPRLRQRHSWLLNAYRVHDALIVRRDGSAVRRAVEEHGFAVSSDGTLFELLVTFRLRDELADLGFRLTRLRLIDGRLRFDARRAGDRVTVWYQRTPPGWRSVSRYRTTLRGHGVLDAHDLRPDLVLRIEVADGPARWVVVEAKTTTTGKPTSMLVRRAVADLLAYQANYRDVLLDHEDRALGVVWGRDLSPADHAVAVCTPDRLAEALTMLVGRVPI